MEELMLLLTACPNFAVAMAVIGMLRTINKPVFALAQKIIESTETDKDDQVWAKIRDHKAMKAFLWLLDFTTSIKIPKK